MQMTFRWYGDSDPVTLTNIRQIPGVHGIVSAVYDVAAGEVWPIDTIRTLQRRIAESGLRLAVIESVPVPEPIKLGTADRDRLIANFAQTLRNLAACEVPVVCYNFMPLFDWFRTTLDQPLPDGSNTLALDAATLATMEEGGLSPTTYLPGWDVSYTPAERSRLCDQYIELGEAGLRENLAYFLKSVVPTAIETGIKLAIHPDDPPYSIFGIPRIVKNREDLAALLAVVDHPANGLTLCSGSLGAGAGNDVAALVREFAGRGRVHFAHMRNIKLHPGGGFHESAHLSTGGSLDMAAIMRAYSDAGFTGPMRPDHGRMIWGETGRPGYGLYDRALGATYLNGLWEGIAAARV